MKIFRTNIMLLLISLIFSDINAQNIIATDVYPWNSNGQMMFDGSGAILARQSLKGHSIQGGKRLKFQEAASGSELFFIIKEGPVQVKLNGNSYRVDKGSVVFILPGDEVSFFNDHRDPVEIYELQMQSASPDLQRGIWFTKLMTKGG
jgi:mannose-6-phosphate isomerase-like protein (cupin superfamily)